MDRLELNEVLDYLGAPTKIDSKHHYFQCPECLDVSRNNLIYTDAKGLLTSFCCDSSHAIYGEIMQRRRGGQTNPVKQIRATASLAHVQIAKPILSEEKKTELLSNQAAWNKKLLAQDRVLKHLYQTRGITKNTVELTGLGLDVKKESWTLPVYDGSNLIGFEYRAFDFGNKKIWKEIGTYSCLASINAKTVKTEVLVILEGFWDAYCFLQHLIEQNQSEYYKVTTPSNGVASVLKCFEDIDFQDYKKVILYLDSDSKGIEAMAQIKAKYSFIETITMDCGCKDFNEHYLKCIKKYKEI